MFSFTNFLSGTALLLVASFAIYGQKDVVTPMRKEV